MEREVLRDEMLLRLPDAGGDDVSGVREPLSGGGAAAVTAPFPEWLSPG